MLTDPDEGTFLEFLSSSPNDHSSLLTYAEYLRDKDKMRSEFLRLEYLLAGKENLGGLNLEQQIRYRELLNMLDPFEKWLQLVRRNNRLMNCPQSLQQPFHVRFEFRCPNLWETLTPTEESGVRHCGDCQQTVHYCDTVELVELHAKMGDCIAVPARVTATVRKELTSGYVGRPDAHQIWERKLFGS